jgi:hypothetical protein
VLAPKKPAVSLRQGGDLVGDCANLGHVSLITHIEQGSNVQTPDVRMSEHSVFEALLIQYRTEPA